MRTPRLLEVAGAALLLAMPGGPARAAALGAAEGSGPDFGREVGPILAGSCVRGHSAAAPQGQLRLDSAEALRKGGASGPVVVAGRPAESPLFLRLTLTDAAKRMPWMSEPLKPAEIETLRRWIEAGAAWPEGVLLTATSAAATSQPSRPSAAPVAGGLS